MTFYETLKRIDDEDFKRREKEFKLQPLDRIIKYLPNPSLNMRKKITCAHRDFEEIATAIAQKEDWATISGLNPSGPLHFGHKTVFDEVIWLQQQGAEAYIPVTDDETYLVGKTNTMAESRKNAHEEVIPSLIALGLKPEKTHIWVDSEYKDIYNLSMKLSKKLTYSTCEAVFGFKGETNPGTIFYRSAVQLAAITLPQLEEFGGPKATAVPVGIDQDPYIMLIRDIIKKEGLRPPSGIYLHFLHGLDGKGKMSKSRSESVIHLNEDPKTAKAKIMSGFTGGRPSIKEQKIYGGNPDICPIFSLDDFHFTDTKEAEKIYNDCKSGSLTCGEHKQRLVEKVQKFLGEHKEKKEKAKNEIEKYMLDVPLNSLFK